GVGWDAAVPPPSAPPRARHPLVLARRQIDFVRQHGWAALGRKLMGRSEAPANEIDFSRHARPAPGKMEYWTVLRESIVSIGVNRYPSPRFAAGQIQTYSRLRDIEAPMAGACYLTEW